MIRILICGGRNYTDQKTFDKEVDAILDERYPGEDVTIISGMARGADSLAVEYARDTGEELLAFPADWETHGKAAGFIRNQQMLDDGKPDLVIAFPGGRGTADMIRRARKAGVPVVEPVS